MALVAIVAAVSGLVGYVSSTSEEVSPATSFVTSPLITGHLTVEARDSDGNLKAVRTSDNAIITRFFQPPAEKSSKIPVFLKKSNKESHISLSYDE